jgi:hypothetical protein
MQTMTIPKNYSKMTVYVPKGAIRRFRSVTKTLGVEIETKSSMDRALEDIEAGRVNSYSSVDEMINAIL